MFMSELMSESIIVRIAKFHSTFLVPRKSFDSVQLTKQKLFQLFQFSIFFKKELFHVFCHLQYESTRTRSKVNNLLACFHVQIVIEAKCQATIN